MKDKITVGLLLDREYLPLWIFNILETIENAEFALIKLVVYTHMGAGEKNKKYSFLYRLHEKTDKYLFRRIAKYSNIMNASGLLNGKPAIAVPSSQEKQQEEFNDLFHEISKHNLDIVLNFSSFVKAIPGIKVARFGIWRYGIENKDSTDFISNGYWEMVKKVPELGIHISSTNNFLEKKIVLHRGWIPTNFNSIQMNLDHINELGSVIIPRLIRGLSQSGNEFLNSRVIRYDGNHRESSGISLYPPTNFQAFRNLMIIIFRYVYGRLKYRAIWKWFLMFKFDSDPFPHHADKYSILHPPKDRFWADPFVICKDDEIFVFVEELIYTLNKAYIVLLVLNQDGHLIRSEKILEKPYHLSYPFVFEHDGTYFMIPETSENRTVELYRSDEFPVKWSFVMNLKENVNARDTTLFHYKDKWWLFTAITECRNFQNYDELFLFFSDDLFTTDWIPHPNNPIVTDTRNARPAGKVFQYENKIYRPSQDCSGRYGSAFNLNQITVLNEKSYHEKLISKTEANWDPELKGTHTFNFDRNFTIIDAYSFKKRFGF